MFNLEGYQAVRAGWLQGLVTNEVENLAEGESRYAAWLTPQGRMITDMNVVAEGDRLLLDVPATLAAGLRDRLDALIFSEDARVTDESGRLRVWTVISTRCRYFSTSSTTCTERTRSCSSRSSFCRRSSTRRLMPGVIRT